MMDNSDDEEIVPEKSKFSTLKEMVGKNKKGYALGTTVGTVSGAGAGGLIY